MPDTIHNIDLIEAATRILHTTDEEKIYELIGETIGKSVPGLYISINKIDTITNVSTIKYIYGAGKILQSLKKIFDFNPFKLVMPLKEGKVLSALRKSRLVRIPNGLYELGLGYISKSLCDFVEKMFHIKATYFIGLNWEDKPLCSIAMLSQNKLTEDETNFIEKFSLLITAALHRINKEEYIVRQEKEFRTFFNAVPIGLYRTTIEGKVLMANEATVNMLGHENNQEVINRERAQEGYESSFPREKFIQILEKQGKINGLETKWTRKDGSKIYVRENARAVKDEYGNIQYLEGTIEDITFRREAEEKLRQAKEFNEMTFEVSPSAMFTVDTAQNIKSWNKRAYELTGYTDEEVVGKKCSFFTKDTCGVQCGIFSNAEKSPILNITCHIQRKDGEIRQIRKNAGLLMDNDNNIIGAIESFEDVTKQIRQQAELERAHRSMAFLMESATNFLTMQDKGKLYYHIGKELSEIVPESIIIINRYNPEKMQLETQHVRGLEGKLEKISKLLGYDLEKNSYPIEPNDIARFNERQLFEYDDKEILKENRFFKNSLYKMMKKMLGIHKVYFIGLYYQHNFLGNIAILTKNNKEIENYNLIKAFIFQASVAIDRALMEGKLMEAKEKAEESTRLKSAFLANMSHEIRTPMNGILGFTEMLKTRTLSTEKQQYYLDIIHTNGTFLLKLINDILDISKIQSGQLELNHEHVNVNKLLAEQYSFFKLNIEKSGKAISLKYHSDFKDHEMPVYTDPFRLQQILTNLLGNAFKFTESGKIEFGARKISGKNVEFFISDTGIGMSKETVEKIFERFNQGDSSISRKYGGSGLGLAISQGLLEIMGGKIRVNSTEQRGSEFSFQIPLAKQKKLYPIINDKQATLTNTIRENLTILIAEDDPSSSFYLQEILSAYKINVLIAINGFEAVDLVEKNHDISLVLMDINMPGMDGIEATKHIGKLKPELPIIAQTANAMSGDKRKYLEAGCLDYIPKPIDENMLINKIITYL